MSWLVPASVASLLVLSLCRTAHGLEPIDLGAPSMPGVAEILPHQIIIQAGGTNIAGTRDQGFFLHELREGDFDLKIRVESMDHSHVWAKAGLMARLDLEADSPHASVFTTPSISGCLFMHRPSRGASGLMNGFFPANHPFTWLRLERTGNQLRGYAGYDGEHWRPLGQTTLVQSSEPLHVGLAATSQNPERLTTVRVSPLMEVASPKSLIEFPREPVGPSSRRTGLVISEIMHRPLPREDGKELEFVELLNSNFIPEDLSGFRLAGAIEFTFPQQTVLDPGAFLVIAKAPADLESAYGIAGVLGGYTGSLAAASNGTIELRNSRGAMMLEALYSSACDWPAAASGGGHSLVLARPSHGENEREAWSASSFLGGSPGKLDPVHIHPLRSVVINEFLANSGPGIEDFIELFNYGPEPVDISGCFLTDNPSRLKFKIPSGTQLPPGGLIAFTESQLGFALRTAGEEIFLLDPEAAWVMDGIIFEAQARGVSFGRSPDGSPVFRELAEKTPGTPNSAPLLREIIINELMYNPISGNDDDEYVELYNRGSAPVDLSGWRIADGIEFTIPANVSIPPDGYLVIARNAVRLMANYPNLNPSNTVGNFRGRLANSGERIALLMPEISTTTNPDQTVTTNTIYITVNEVTYRDGGRWGIWADGGGSSLELVHPWSDNRLAASWADSDETQKAPWTLVEHTGVLDHGMQNIDHLHVFLLGAGASLLDDVEVIGPGGTNLLANSTFEDGILRWVFQGNHSESRLEPAEGFQSGQSLLISALGRGDPGANRIRTPLPAVLNIGQTATIRARVRWLRGHPEVLLRLRGNYLEATGRLNIPSNLGTPGARNSRALDHPPPAIHEVAHFPVLPEAHEPVLVRARLHDPGGSPSISLHYRVDPGSQVVVIPMRDDGEEGDAFPNDGIYSALIPGQAGGARVAFFLEAASGAIPSASSRFPENAPVRECLVRFGETQPSGNLGTYRIWITTATHSRWSSRLKLDNGALDSTFVYGNFRAVYNTGALYSGSPFVSRGYDTPTGQLCGYVLQFPKDDRVLGAADFVLDWPIRDNSLQMEHVAYWIADQLGLPYNHRRFVRLFVNGTRRATVYEDTQQPNRHYLRGWYPEDFEGDLYKIEDWFEFDPSASSFSNRDASLQRFTTTGGELKPARYRWNWRKRAVRDSANDYQSLFELVNAVNTPGGDAYTAAVEELVDVDQWMRTFAVERIVGNWDSYGYMRGKNMYAYKPQNGTWQLLLWDIDFVLGSGDGPATGLFHTIEPVISRMLQHPPFQRAYWRAFQEAVSGPLLQDQFSPLIDARFIGLRQNSILAGSPNSGKNYLNARRNFLIQQLASLSTSLTVHQNNFTTNKNLVTLTGKAPVAIKTIQINGVDHPVTWTSATDWRATVVLASGQNSLSFSGLDAHGKPVPGSNVTSRITYTGPVELPEEKLVINEIMYHPEQPGAEFIEIHNTSSENAFDLSHYRLAGVDFRFKAGTIIFPQGFLVVAKSRATFASTYGTGIPIAGEFKGALRQDGERLRLFRPGIEPGDEVLVTEVIYSNAPPWPREAAGNGSSLQLIDPARENHHPGNWGAVANSVELPPEWKFVTVTGTASSSILYLYHEGGASSEPDGIAGEWNGELNFPGETIEIAVWFAQDPSGNLTGVLLEPEEGLGDIPLLDIEIDGNLISFGLEGFPPEVKFSATLSEDRQTITGLLGDEDFSAPFVLRRAGAAGAELHIDDLRLVAGTVAGAGKNLIRNGAFEEPVEGSWNLAGNHSRSDIHTGLSHNGSASLRLAASGPGDGMDNSVWQETEPLITGHQYTLSYWYLPSQSARNLTVRLSGGGLTSSHSARAQTVNTTLARYTPGAPNSIRAELPPFPPIWINEVQAENLSGPTDGEGRREPWIELHHSGTSPLALDGLYLTDDYLNLTKWSFPSNAVIAPGEFLLVWADGQPQRSTATEWHTSFRLPPAAGKVALARTHNGVAAVADFFEYNQLAVDRSMGRYPDGYGRAEHFHTPTPAAPNTLATSFIDVFINEWMASNRQTVADPADGQYDDWFELFNAGPSAVDLTGYTLTDNLNNPAKFTIPPAIIIPAGGFLLVWADGQPEQNTPGANDLHVNFRLSQSGEEIGLFAPDGSLIDSVVFGEQQRDVSQGRWPDGHPEPFHFFPAATPGFPNKHPEGEQEFRLSGAITLAGQQLTLSWRHPSATRFLLQYKNSLSEENWAILQEIIVAPGEEIIFNSAIAPDSTQRFFRVVLLE